MKGRQPIGMVQKLKQVLGTLKGRKIALLGLSFKPMTDDIREAPSLFVSNRCLHEGAEVHAYDPLIKHFPIKEVHLYEDLNAVLTGADAAIILTEWNEFRELDWEPLSIIMKNPIIVDGRNIYPIGKMEELAKKQRLIYISAGRPQVVGIFP